MILEMLVLSRIQSRSRNQEARPTPQRPGRRGWAASAAVRAAALHRLW